MKRTVSLILSLMLICGCAAAQTQQEQLIMTATVQSPRTVAIKAPATGELAGFALREGDVAAAGDVLFEVQPVHVYADADGVVADVYVAAGDIADAAVARFGAVMQIDHAQRYRIQASTLRGYDSVENRDLHVGTPVYLCSNNEKRTGEGVVTQVDGSNFTVHVLSGDLEYGKAVKIYRDEEYSDKMLLSRSVLSAAAPYAVSASGTVVQVAVQRGDIVRAGDHLFSYVPDSLDPQRRGAADALCAKADEALIITAVNVQQGAAVQKGQVLAMAVPMGQYELCAQAEEGDVGSIAVGDVFTVCFEELGLDGLTASVTAISPLGAQGDVSKYTVRLAFDAPQGVWPGMHATLER